MNIILSLLAGFLAGVAGSMGLGGGSVLLIYLTVFAGVSQLTAQGLNLIFFLPTAALAIFIYSKKKIIKWKEIMPIMIFGALGTIISSWIVNFINVTFLRQIFGGLIALLGIYEVFRKKKKLLKK
ncbi:MAG: TSUP family transporter [Acutalibacteraceae bacterium]|nr:TSUP family transporter [Acutalibacteraceae bacterium]